jgi:O-antigen ligase
MRDPLRMSMFLVTVITVSRVHQHWPFIARLRPALLLVLLTAAYAGLNPRYLSRENLLRTRPAKLMAAFGILACISAVFGISLGNSGFFILTSYSKTLIYAFLLIAAIRHTADLYTFAWSYVVSSGILVFFAQFVFGLSRSSGSQAERLSDLYMYDANDLGLVLLVGLSLALWLFPSANRWQKVLLTVLLFGIGATLARTGSRGAFLGIIATGLGMLVFLNTVTLRKRLAFLGITVVALAIGAPAGYWDQMRTILAPTKDYNYTSRDGRKEVLQRGIGYMLDYPVSGIGIANFSKAECTISEKAREHFLGTGIRCIAPHNSYVQAGAELGVPGLLVWLAIVFGGIVGLIRLRRRIPATWARGDPEQRFLYAGTNYLALALVGFSVTSFFISFAYMDPIYILCAMIAGLHVSMRHRLRREQMLLGATASPPPLS